MIKILLPLVTLLFAVNAFAFSAAKTADAEKKPEGEKKAESRVDLGVGVPLGMAISTAAGSSSSFNYGLTAEGRFGDRKKDAVGLFIHQSKSSAGSGAITVDSRFTLLGTLFGVGFYPMEPLCVTVGGKLGLGISSVVSTSAFVPNSTSSGMAIGGFLGADFKVIPQLSIGGEMNFISARISGSSTGISHFLGVVKYWMPTTL